MIDLDSIAPAFSFVSDKGFAPNLIDYKPQEFGNAVLIMKGTVFSLRFIRDRGQIFVDAGNNVAGWYKLEHLLEFVNDSRSIQQHDESHDLTKMAIPLQMQWENVVSVFNNQNKILQFKIFSEQKSTAWLRKMLDKPF